MYPLVCQPSHEEPTSSQAALGNAPENLTSLAKCLHLKDDVLIDIVIPNYRLVLEKFSYVVDTRSRSIGMSTQ